MGRSQEDLEAWLEAVDYHLDGQSHTDFEDRDHSEAWAAGLSPGEYADILLDSISLHDDNECWP